MKLDKSKKATQKRFPPGTYVMLYHSGAAGLNGPFLLVCWSSKPAEKYGTSVVLDKRWIITLMNKKSKLFYLGWEFIRDNAFTLEELEFDQDGMGAWF